MDCRSFDTSLVELLYGEIDAPSAAAMEEHATGCDECGPRLAQLERVRELFRPLAEAPAPAGLEAKILAAAEAAVAIGQSAVPAVPQLRSGGRVLRLFARPELAIAATFLLVIGAMMALRTTARAPQAQSAAMAPAASASAGTIALAPALDPAPAPTAEVAATTTATASAFALAAPVVQAKGAAARADSDDEALAPAKALFKAGRYAEARPLFDALAPTNREAALYAARCVARTQGCGAAAPRFDAISRDGSGTEAGSHAALEIARCYKTAGEVAAARPRYEALATDNYVAGEAQAGLADLDAPRAAKPVAKPAKAAAPAATTNVTH